jgi:hypothetical protein
MMPPPQDKLTILFLAANPRATTPLQLDEEVRAVDAALRKADYGSRLAAFAASVGKR